MPIDPEAYPVTTAIHACLTEFFPEWDWDQREAIAASLAKAALAAALKQTTDRQRIEYEAALLARDAAGHEELSLADTINSQAEELRAIHRKANANRPVIRKVGNTTEIDVRDGRYTFVLNRENYLEDILAWGKPWFAPRLRDDQIIFNYAIGPLAALVVGLAEAIPARTS